MVVPTVSHLKMVVPTISWHGGNKLVVRRMGDITFEVEVDITSQLHDKEDFFEENYSRWPSHHLTSEDLKLTWHHIWRWSSQLSLIWRWLCPPSPDTTTHLWIIATVTIIILIIIIIIITCSYHQYHHNLMILIILRDAIMAQNGSLFTQCVKGGISTKNNQIDQHEKWSPHKTIISSLPLLFLAAQRLSQDGSERLLNIEHLLLQDWSLPKHQTFGWRIFIARLNASLS